MRHLLSARRTFIRRPHAWTAASAAGLPLPADRTADRLILVDTGLGLNDVAHPHPRLSRGLTALLHPRHALAETAHAQIAALGYATADVRDIALPHLDFDHAARSRIFRAHACTYTRRNCRLRCTHRSDWRDVVSGVASGAATCAGSSTAPRAKPGSASIACAN
ncbi:hypothetical protein ABU614_19650 [Lysobacter firmicutimachus]|uniref:Uncharacterized protein n=1 Tax=Lysobacter firmicutimachus TaxID=1792846 RepID=A0AAU8MTV0_9GAMM